MAEKNTRRSGVLETRIGVGKVLADVAQSARAEQCVDDGMAENIGIGVALGAAVVLDGHTADDQRPAGHEPVAVISDARPDDAHPSRPGRPASRSESRSSATRRSSGVVIFRLPGVLPRMRTT